MANLHSKTIQISPKQLPRTVTPDAGYDGLECVEIISSFKSAWQGCSYDCYGPLEGAYGQNIPYIRFDGDFLAALGYEVDDEVRFTQWQFWRPLTAYQYQSVKQSGSVIITPWYSYYDSNYGHAVVQPYQPWRLTQVWNARSQTILDDIVGRVRVATDFDQYSPGCILKFTGQVTSDCWDGIPSITYSAFFINFLDDPSVFWLMGIYAEELNEVVTLSFIDEYIWEAFDSASIDLTVDQDTL